MFLMLLFACMSYVFNHITSSFLKNTQYNSIIKPYNLLSYVYSCSFAMYLYFILHHFCWLFLCFKPKIFFLHSSHNQSYFHWKNAWLVPSLHLKTILPLYICYVSIKTLIFLHLQSVAICYGCLLIALPQNLPHIIPYSFLVLYWVRILTWYRDLKGKIYCVVFLDLLGVMRKCKCGFVSFFILIAVFQY